jgi:hypothetical protein
MSLSERQQIFAMNVSLLISKIFASGYRCTLGEAYRTPEQAKIYAKEGKGIIDSQHCKKLAIDLNLFSPEGVYLDKTEDYKAMGEYWKSLHPDNKWGGVFSRGDGNHFQMKD